MGTNKRYAEHYDQLRDQRIREVIMRGGQPESLTDQELDIQAITRTPLERPVKVWVRYGVVPVLLDAEAVAWTSCAVAVRWPGPEGAIHKAWVGSSAVRDR